MRLSNKIVLATLNRDKFDEFHSLFTAYPEVELVEVESIIRNPSGLRTVEKYDSYLENAMAKARICNQASHYPCLADDSGLEVLALEGKLGVHSHRYAPPRAGVHQDQANNELLLQEMKSKTDRSAKFVATLVLLIEGIMISATGVLEGTLLEHPRGSNGFGYDPLFLPKDSQKTLAEMTSSEKNRISHRAKALNELMTQIKANGIVFAKP